MSSSSTLDAVISATKRKKKISKLAKVVKKKYLALRLGKSEEDKAIQKLFKPISTPLQQIVTNTQNLDKNLNDNKHIKTEIKKEEKKEEEEEEKDADVSALSQPTFLPTQDIASTNAEEDDLFFSEVDDEEAGADTHIEDPTIEAVEEYLDHYPEMAQKRTPGLYQLIFYVDPSYNKDDKESYKTILELSRVHEDSLGRMKGSTIKPVPKFYFTSDGNIDANNLKNFNVSNPTEPRDVASKEYVDGNMGNVINELMNNRLVIIPSSSKHTTEKIQLVNELHKPARKNYPRRRTIIKGLDDLWQSDLAEMSNYAKDNRQYKYILVVIDCFSKFLWTRPIKNKTGQEVTQANEDILFHTNKRVPTNLQTDQGTQYYNRTFNNLMKKIQYQPL
ncbi:hypothetical protein NQ315_014837 [Exocentrus adspersus]|uniref:Integrase catalytic domain-containing protein n=1 Tax=Exocentrus adspersus TaxID=1586481 RepID=A0AAV8VLK6_9CUCU|nr:hypothetical protein NQ315_014837 [Exocentrus adspersus]